MILQRWTGERELGLALILSVDGDEDAHNHWEPIYVGGAPFAQASRHEAVDTGREGRCRADIGEIQRFN